MNIFDKKLKESGKYPLKAVEITTLQVNVGYKCNLRCSHCHVEASPDRTEMMSLTTMHKITDILKKHREITTLDITGGSPEFNPNLIYLVKSVSEMGKKIMVRSNLTVYLENGMDKILEALKENKVKIIASLPCYTEQGVDVQRGNGTYKKAISVFKRLNEMGYGKQGSGLEIDIMFNPAKAEIAPDQHTLEKAYKEKLNEMHDITFNHLIALSNMPIGRLRKSISDEEVKQYIKTLEEKFNPATIENLMCRHLISVSPNGKLYDCDFWQMLKMSVKNECRDVDNFDYKKLSNREIVTNPLCLMCTAGAGASCTGALA